MEEAAKEEYRVGFLSECPEFIPQVSRNCFSEWGITYGPYGITDIAGVEEDHHNMLKNNANNTKIPIPIICYTTRYKNVEGGETVAERVLCGGCAVEDEDIHDRKDLIGPWLTSVYVEEEFRRKGVAKLLLDRALAVTKELGYTHIWLWTENNYGSLEFYKKCGFAEIEKTTYLGKQITIMKNTFGN